jgi:hypothetical protein
MVLKLSKGVWLVSVMAMLAALLFVYAGVPENVIVTQNGADYVYVGREVFFYVSLAVITLINSLVFMVSAMYKKDELLRAWFNGLVGVLNLFFIISLLLINSINSNEKFDYERIGFMIYGSVILVAVWAISWPIIALIRKFSGKASI